MDISSYLRQRGGGASTSELRRAGFGRTGVDSSLAAGAVTRVRRGLYVLNEDSQYRAAREHNGLLTCLSAATSYQLWTLNAAQTLHLSIGHRPNLQGVVIHRRHCHPRHPWLPVTGLADVLLHALHCLPEREALVMVQCAVGQGLVSLDFLRNQLQGNRNARPKAVLDWVIPRADSLLEVLANTVFRRAGLQVLRHVEIPGVGEVDFLIEGCLVVETDGGTHLEPRQVKKDRRRNNATLVGGYLVLRYGYDDVVHHPERMLAEVLEVLERRRRGAFDAR
jgi:very-short-patch-repair endonuclease